MKSQSTAAALAVFMGGCVAVILVVVWLFFALIAWNFTVTAIEVRALLVISFATVAVTFVVAKIQKL